jgi:SAM-dependent methyltransferase
MKATGLALVILLTVAGRSSAATATTVRASEGGWTLPAAVRAVTLNNPGLSLPAGLTREALTALPAGDVFWQLAAQAVKSKQQEGLSGAEVVGLALARADAQLKKVTPHERSLTLAETGAAVLAAGNVDPELLVQQYALQHNKDLIRSLREYHQIVGLDERRFYSVPDDQHASSRVFLPRAKSIAPLLEGPRAVKAMLNSQRARHGRVIHADVGGGLGIPQRELAKMGKRAGDEFLLVDLFDWEKISPDRLAHAVDYYGGKIFSPELAPRVVLGDAASVRFSDASRPNLITSVASVQYWPDKLRGFVNLYNELADDGLLAVADEHDWGTWIRTQGDFFRYASPIFDDVVNAMAQAEIEMAAVIGRSQGPVQNVSSPVVRKKPGTRLRLNARLREVWVNPHGYAASYYAAMPEGLSPVEVLSAP